MTKGDVLILEKQFQDLIDTLEVMKKREKNEVFYVCITQLIIRIKEQREYFRAYLPKENK